MKIVLATNNKNKIKELSQILGDTFQLLTLKEVGINFDVEETGTTFKENAYKKAKEYYNACKIPVLAEDSGLCINALEGYPGIYSKRIYENKGKTIKESEYLGNKLILEKLENIKDRTAYYIASYCYYDGNNIVYTEGKTLGYITNDISGEYGFAYDKIFFSNELNKKMSEVTDKEKNKISHRKKGIEQLLKIFSINQKNTFKMETYNRKDNGLLIVRNNNDKTQIISKINIPKKQCITINVGDTIKLNNDLYKVIDFDVVIEHDTITEETILVEDTEILTLC